MLTHLSNHAQTGLQRLLTQYQGKPLMAGLVNAMARQVQALEDARWDLLTLRALSRAAGAQQDGLGEIVGQPREGRDDPTYLLWLSARIQLNRSAGTIPDLINIFNHLLAGLTVHVQTQPPAALAMKLGGVDISAQVVAFFTLLKLAAGGGVRVVLEYQTADNAHSFCFAGGPGLGFGAGKFASAKGE